MAKREKKEKGGNIYEVGTFSGTKAIVTDGENKTRFMGIMKFMNSVSIHKGQT